MNDYAHPDGSGSDFDSGLALPLNDATDAAATDQESRTGRATIPRRFSLRPLTHWLGRLSHHARSLPLKRSSAKTRTVDTLRETLDSVQAIARQMDPDFTQLAADLKSLHAGAAELSQSTSASVTSARQALLEGRLVGADGLTARSLAELRAGLDEAAHDLEALGRMSGVLDQLQVQTRHMERMARMLRTSSSVFAIESARSAACQQAFGAFVTELRQLAEKIQQLGGVIGDQSQGIQQQVVRITRSLRNDLAELHQLVQSSEQAVHQTSERVQQLLDSSWNALQQSDARAREVARHANAAAYHLQFGDIVRQKLEHVVAGLDAADAATRTSRQRGSVEADLIVAIQVGQLEMIRSEISSAQAELTAAFTGLAEQTDGLVHEAGQLAGTDQHSTGPAGDLFAKLKDALLRLDTWHARGRQLCAEAQKLTREAAEYSAKLAEFLEQVQAVNRDMHLQALNAIVKTALLGEEGVTLGVLSSHVHSISDESKNIVKSTAQLLERIREQACGSLAAASNMQSSVEIRSSLAQILGIPQTFQATAQASLSIAQRQQEQLTAARARLEFFDRLSAELQAVVTTGNAIREEFGSAKPAAYRDVETDALIRNYTMESEREVHRRIIHTLTGTTPPPAPTPKPVVAEVADFEFFDAPTPPLPPATASEPAPAGVALAATATDLGDNVELF